MSESSVGLAAALREVEKLGVLSVEVPEWPDENGKPIKVHWKPISSAKVMKYAGKKKSQALALVIVENALDANGNKLFNPGDHVTLAGSAHYKTVSKVANAILGNDEDDDSDEDGDFEPPLKES